MSKVEFTQRYTRHNNHQPKFHQNTYRRHTAGSDTIFIQIYMDALPGVPGVSKNQIFFLQIKLLSSCAKIAPKRHKLFFSSFEGTRGEKNPKYFEPKV